MEKGCCVTQIKVEHNYILNRPYTCTYPGCTKSYTRSQHLARHIDVSHREKSPPAFSTSFICELCDKEQTFSSKYSLKKHQKRIHGEEKQYVCRENGCKESFRKRHQLKAHSYFHKGVLPFQCDHAGCGKQFKQISHLQVHQRGHEGYRCNEKGCTVIFTRMSLLRKHKAKEHKPVYSCKKCDKWYYRQCLLQNHLRVHSDVCEKFKCPVKECERSYFESRNLTAHIKSHHKGHRFPCQECGKEFSSKQKQLQHLKQHNPKYRGRLPKPKPKGVDMAKRVCKFISGKTPEDSVKNEESSFVNDDNANTLLTVPSLKERTIAIKDKNISTFKDIKSAEDQSISSCTDSESADESLTYNTKKTDVKKSSQKQILVKDTDIGNHNNHEKNYIRLTNSVSHTSSSPTPFSDELPQFLSNEICTKDDVIRKNDLTVVIAETIQHRHKEKCSISEEVIPIAEDLFTETSECSFNREQCQLLTEKE